MQWNQKYQVTFANHEHIYLNTIEIAGTSYKYLLRTFPESGPLEVNTFLNLILGCYQIY